MVRDFRGVEFCKVGGRRTKLVVEITRKGRYLCPICIRRWDNVWSGALREEEFQEHLLKDHWECLECGWIGTSPTKHLAKATQHGGVAPSGGPKGRRTTIV